MRQADEFVIVLRIGAQTADGDGHTALKHTVELRLRTVGFLKVMQELPGSRRQLQFLCAARKRCSVCLDLLQRRLLALERNEARRHMTV